MCTISNFRLTFLMIFAMIGIVTMLYILCAGLADPVKDAAEALRRRADWRRLDRQCKEVARQRAAFSAGERWAVMQSKPTSFSYPARNSWAQSDEETARAIAARQQARPGREWHVIHSPAGDGNWYTDEGMNVSDTSWYQTPAGFDIPI